MKMKMKMKLKIKKSTGITKNAKELSEIEKDVIASIQKKKILLSFRPLLNTYSNVIDTYEIAVKLNSHSKRRLFYLESILPIINRLGLGREYDFTLIKHVIDLLPLVDDTISFTFNLSPFSLRDHCFSRKAFYLPGREKGRSIPSHHPTL